MTDDPGWQPARDGFRLSSDAKYRVSDSTISAPSDSRVTGDFRVDVHGASGWYMVGFGRTQRMVDQIVAENRLRRF